MRAFRFTAAWILGLAAFSQAQMTFTVRGNADITTVGSDFGFRAGMTEPFAGLNLYRVSTEVEDSDVSASVYMIQAGVRQRLSGAELRPYLSGSLVKYFTNVETSADEEPAGISEMEDILSPWGIHLAFGAEYAFSERLACFGEYGLRILFSSGKVTTGEEYNSTTGNYDDTKSDLNMNLGVATGHLGLRFFF